MSDKVVVTKSKITAIADAIRSKLSSEDTYTLNQMPDAIESIGGGGKWILISDFDFVSGSDHRRYDKARDYSISTGSYTGIGTTSNGIQITSNSGRLHPEISYTIGQEYKVEIDIGECVDSGTNTNNLLFTDSYGTKHGLSYNRTNGYWQLIRSSDLNLTELTDPLYFNNKTITLYFGYYNNAINKTWKIDIDGTIYDLDSNSDITYLCLGSGTGNNAYNGAEFTGFRVYMKSHDYSE